jgi:hypothetical protein
MGGWRVKRASDLQSARVELTGLSGSFLLTRDEGADLRQRDVALLVEVDRIEVLSHQRPAACWRVRRPSCVTLAQPPSRKAAAVRASIAAAAPRRIAQSPSLAGTAEMITCANAYGYSSVIVNATEGINPGGVIAASRAAAPPVICKVG